MKCLFILTESMVLVYFPDPVSYRMIIEFLIVDFGFEIRNFLPWEWVLVWHNEH